MHPLRNRSFRALAIGQAVNGIGSWCALIAIWGYATERFHATPWQISVLGLTWTIPGALLGPMAGVPTDRWDPRRVLIVADSLAAGCAIGMAFTNTYWGLVVWSSAQGFAKSFAMPAFGALTPRVVSDEQLPVANAILNSAMQASIAFGPVLGAAAIELSGAKGAFLVDAFTYCIGVAVVIPLVLSPIAKSQVASPWSDALEGIRVVRARPEVMRLFAGAVGVYALWGAGVTIEPLYVRDILERSPATFAYLQTAFGVMMVLVGFVVARVGERSTRIDVVAAGAIASGLCAALYLATPLIGVAFLAIALWGVSTPWFTTPMRTLLQRATPAEAHGRVFALDETLRSWAMAVATGSAGFAYSEFGYRGAGVLYASLPVLGGLVILSGARRRKLRSTSSTDNDVLADAL